MRGRPMGETVAPLLLLLLLRYKGMIAERKHRPTAPQLLQQILCFENSTESVMFKYRALKNNDAEALT